MEADGTISKHVPIIAVTANARMEQIMGAKHSGMVGSYGRLLVSRLTKYPGRCYAQAFQDKTTRCQNRGAFGGYHVLGLRKLSLF